MKSPKEVFTPGSPSWPGVNAFMGTFNETAPGNRQKLFENKLSDSRPITQSLAINSGNPGIDIGQDFIRNGSRPISQFFTSNRRSIRLPQQNNFIVVVG